MIEAVRNYVLECPFLDDLAKLDVDFLDNEAVNYSIESLPGDPIFKKYADGGKMGQFDFVLASRAFYGESVRGNVDNLSFFTKFREWVEENNRKKKVPLLTGGRESQYVEVLTDGYIFSTDADTAKYQVQCKLYYYENRR